MPADSIIAKVQKLLRLADSERGGTEAERDLAMQRAQELMLKHNLSTFQLTEQSAPGGVDEADHLFSGTDSIWKGRLLASIGRACFVDALFMKVGRHGSRWTLVGRADNLAFVKVLGEHLIPWLEQEAKDAARAAKQAQPGLNPKAFKRSFFQAATMRVEERLAVERNRKLGDASTDIVIHERHANKEHIDSKYQTKTGRRSGSRNLAGHSAGREAGNRADLSPGRKLGVGK